MERRGDKERGTKTKRVIRGALRGRRGQSLGWELSWRKGRPDDTRGTVLEGAECLYVLSRALLFLNGI